MTRRKDKIRQKQEEVRRIRNLGKSRLVLQQEEKKKEEEEKKKEVQLLDKVKKIPTELIRIIFSYLSGNAKLVCNYKFDYLDRHSYLLEYLINELPKKDVLDLIHKGILRKYPDIVEKFEEYFYCRDIQRFSDVRGQRLLQLWETDNLIYDTSGNISNIEENKVKIDKRMKNSIGYKISRYIRVIKSEFQWEKQQLLIIKNKKLHGNTLFLDLDKAFYLYKCLEYFMNMRCPKKQESLSCWIHSIPLIPVPLPF